MFKRIINITIWTFIGLYTIITVLLHIPFVQTFVGSCVSDALCQKFGTKVRVGRVDLGFLNRLIIDDSQMQDQQGKQMLRVSRISVKINPLALANGQIEITSAQFFGMHAYLYKKTAEAKPNFQFVVDSLASKDTTKQKTPLNLQINSLIIRNGSVKWRVLSSNYDSRRFSTDNIDAQNISTHIILNRITDDSLNVRVKRLSLDEHSGLQLKELSLHAVYGSEGAIIEHFRLELPRTLILANSINATFRKKGDKIDQETVRFKGRIESQSITPSDLACLVPKLKDINRSFKLDASFNGDGSSATISRLNIATADSHLLVSANARLNNWETEKTWAATVNELRADHNIIAEMYSAITGKDVPDAVEKIGNIQFAGHAAGSKRHITANGKLQTSLGDILLDFSKQNDNLAAHVQTNAFDIGLLAGNDKIGHISADISMHGRSANDIAAKGRLYDFEYNGYKYQDINLDATYLNKILEGKVDINDPNVQIAINGILNNTGKTPAIKVNADITNIEPHTLKLTEKWPSTKFAANIVADIKGSNLNNMDGTLDVSGFCMQSSKTDYMLDNLNVKTGFEDGRHFLRVDSDFGNIDINGHFDYSSIARGVLNMVATKLPTIPGLSVQPQNEYNDFTINAAINDTRWMDVILGVPLDIKRPLNISGEMDDRQQKLDLWCDVPEFEYNGNRFGDAAINIESPGDTLKADIRFKKLSDKGKFMAVKLSAGASNNRLKTSVSFRNNDRHPLKGVINASTIFAKDDQGVSTAYVDVLESRATIGDSTWHISPAYIKYSKNRLTVDGFSIRHKNQYLAIDGVATNNTEDSLSVTLNGVDVSYILNLVNFHSVEFAGMAYGQATVAGAFSDKPILAANLEVKEFKFENGRMGTLFANVGYNHRDARIEIDAKAKDEDGRHTDINGYVSPKHNYIDLAIDAHRTRAEFMESFCGSFMDNVNADVNGKLNLVGPLNNINLLGKAAVDGSVHLSALNTTYSMRGDSVTFVPDEIKFEGDTIFDRNGNIGILTGSLYHKHLTNLSYDLKVKATNLLAYDTHTFGGNTFYGTAYVTGDCGIRGRSGEVVIDIDAVPEKNSIIVYNVADQTSLGTSDFINWRSHGVAATDSIDSDDDNSVDLATNIRLNFLIKCNPNATIKLLMDAKTGDFITLNGDGVLRASYFNKGSFDMYGNYIVDHGVYKLTIQNIIKKDFLFEKGGTITFGGDPYNASLSLRAQYVLNSVSLADLNIGRSFSNNNVRVNCLMNITGTPNSPKVDFDLDMPNMANDMKQMVYSLLDAEEEKNQQVLYLLAVGRFMAQNNNPAGDNGQYSQTSLAMQSFLSGTISQQLNSVLSNVINSSNWNFGANISTGTEGFNNAEYEGLLSGSMLNNRLLFNGQFGYRDNANATTSFIGDFDLKYLLFPNGNLAVNVYNKTNDRYFTRNSLNTQGLGVIMKKDFTRISDLFFWRKKKKNSNK